MNEDKLRAYLDIQCLLGPPYRHEGIIGARAKAIALTLHHVTQGTNHLVIVMLWR